MKDINIKPNPYIVVGLFLTVILVFISLFFKFSPSESVIIGILGIIITFLIDIVTKLHETIDEKDYYKELFKRLNEEIIKQEKEGVPILNEIKENMIACFDETKNNQFKQILNHQTERYLSQCNQNLQELARGTFKQHGDAYEGVLELASQCQKSIKAISLWKIDAQNWTESKSQFMQKYWEENKRLLKNREKSEENTSPVTRIFIVDQWTLNLKKEVITQLQEGVKVLWVYEKHLQAKCPHCCRDLVLFDDIFVYMASQNNGQRGDNIYSINPYELDEAKDILTTISKYATALNLNQEKNDLIEKIDIQEFGIKYDQYHQQLVNFLQEKISNNSKNIVAIILTEIYKKSLDYLYNHGYQRDKDDRDLILKASQLATIRLWATSLISIDNEWWKAPLWQDYLRENQKLIERGGEVRRIFIYTESEWTDDLTTRAKEQAELGIKVRRIKENEIPLIRTIPKSKLDMVLFDSDLVYVAEVSSAEKRENNIFYYNSENIRKYEDAFKQIWDSPKTDILDFDQSENKWLWKSEKPNPSPN